MVALTRNCHSAMASTHAIHCVWQGRILHCPKRCWVHVLLKSPFHWGGSGHFWCPSTIRFLGFPRALFPNGILIVPAVFARFKVVPKRQTETDHMTLIGTAHIQHCQMWAKNYAQMHLISFLAYINNKSTNTSAKTNNKSFTVKV